MILQLLVYKLKPKHKKLSSAVGYLENV